MAAASVVRLPYGPPSVGVARHRLTTDLEAAGIFDAAVGDAALVVTELLSNAIRHARPLAGSRVRVTWALDAASVRVAVTDGGGASTPRRPSAPASAQSGRGLGIVDQLARSWGVRADDVGTTVWAVLPAPRRAAVSPRGPAPR